VPTHTKKKEMMLKKIMVPLTIALQSHLPAFRAQGRTLTDHQALCRDTMAETK
jgi:hypothetical protein